MVVSAGMTLAVILGASTHVRYVARLSDHGVTTQATVVARSGNRDVRVRVAFDTAGGRVEHMLREDVGDPRVGDRIRVTYDPADPAVVLPASEVGYWRGVPTMLFVLAVMLGFGYLGLSIFLGNFPFIRRG
jgi:hypothetical protein